MKKCNTCKEEKEEAEFSKKRTTADGLQTQCKECASLAHKEWRKNNLEKDKQGRREHYLNNRYSYLNRLAVKTFGITLEEKRKLFENQGSKCAICGSTQSGNRDWHVDHDHTTNKIRGILCRDCNIMLGLAKDNTVTLAAAITYLRENQ